MMQVPNRGSANVRRHSNNLVTSPGFFTPLGWSSHGQTKCT